MVWKSKYFLVQGSCWGVKNKIDGHPTSPGCRWIQKIPGNTTHDPEQNQNRTKSCISQLPGKSFPSAGREKGHTELPALEIQGVKSRGVRAWAAPKGRKRFCVFPGHFWNQGTRSRLHHSWQTQVQGHYQNYVSKLSFLTERTDFLG